MFDAIYPLIKCVEMVVYYFSNKTKLNQGEDFGGLVVYVGVWVCLCCCCCFICCCFKWSLTHPALIIK